eukprot:13494295-Alexandrium_andersonii.AAC.1
MCGMRGCAFVYPMQANAPTNKTAGQHERPQLPALWLWMLNDVNSKSDPVKSGQPPPPKGAMMSSIHIGSRGLMIIAGRRCGNGWRLSGHVPMQPHTAGRTVSGNPAMPRLGSCSVPRASGHA